MFSIGPVSGKSLFQIHAEKVLAHTRHLGRPIPFLVMTSQATHDETESFFHENKFFGLTSDNVFFFQQGEMPALDMATGGLLLETPGKICTSPNGHGGTLAALAESGLIDQLRNRGIQHVFYFQVDNPLTKIADADFLGRHLAAGAEVSCKVVAKRDPTDKLGNFVLVDGRCTMIEYSDLPENLARQRDQEGRLRIWAGNPAIHLFSLDFLGRVTADATALPFHIARKKVPFIDEDGRTVESKRENALKFEMFIFDVLPHAQRWLLVETPRDEEFVPLKNAEGPDSPRVVRQAISNVAADWLERVGVNVPREENGDARFALEISPLYARNADELAGKVNSSMSISGPLYLE